MNNDTHIHIRDFCEQFGQKSAAEALGVSVSAVSQALQADRDIFFIPKGTGYDHYELRKVKSKGRATGNAA